MKRFAPVVCAVACVFALFLTGCACSVTFTNTSNTPSAPAPAKPTTGTQYGVPGGEVLVADSTIIVALDGNPTTGFEWTAEVNGDNLKLVSNDYASSAQSSTAAGAGGVYTFKLEGVGTGTGSVKFTYARSWEQSPDDRWVEITVVTKGGKVTDTVAEDNDGSKSESHS